MANIYVDPSSPTNGVGSEADPRNAWPTSIGANDFIRLKRGTTLRLANQISLGSGSNVTVEDYGDEKLPRPIITSTATTVATINVSVAGINTFRRIHFDGNLSSGNNSGFLTSYGAPTVGASLNVEQCRFTNTRFNAIRLNEQGVNAALYFRCVDCEFDVIGEDCVYGGAIYYEFGRNKCTRVSAGAATGDGVGFIDATPVLAWVYKNYIEHETGGDVKQCIIIDTTSGAGFAIIEDNVLIGWGNKDNPALTHTVILCDCQCIIRRNKITSYGLVSGLSVDNSVFEYNLIEMYNSNIAAPVVAMTANNCIVQNNTFISKTNLNPAQRIVTQGGSVSGNIVRNNIFVNVPTAIKSDTGGNNPTSTYNCFWNVTSPRLDSAGNAFAGGNDITAYPFTTNNYQITEESPCKHAGVYTGYKKDLNGVVVNNPPSIGAFEFSSRGVR